MGNQDEGGSWEKYEDVSYLMIESIDELLNYFPKYVNYYLHCKKCLMGWTQTDFKLHLCITGYSSLTLWTFPLPPIKFCWTGLTLNFVSFYYIINIAVNIQ